MSNLPDRIKFLDGLDPDLRATTLKQLKVLWTHTSTAIEGNSLSLGETQFVLEEGLTISGKPLKDHQEVVGHGHAIDALYGMLGREISEADFYELHHLVLTEKVTDIYKPYGAWKNEPNGTSVVDDSGRQVFIDYAMPKEVPALMRKVIDSINTHSNADIGADDAHRIYADIHIAIVTGHPFWDGNGRIARLAANLPLLNAGLPPVVISQSQRREYLQALAEYQVLCGPVTAETGPWVKGISYLNFQDVCREAYDATKQILDSAFAQQTKREAAITSKPNPPSIDM